ncbi:hypothetical protein LTR37_003835 [Vermiconidia calcicola]|uniref:Uncharacterized protein n=1 Tax=Vermiconidia calcicola TaxID=1690605 RepID=A0ACC3NPF0_9PEZI|nr:hypothetical protein LTR37_003835 [Vermiconidia calcicola]
MSYTPQASTYYSPTPPAPPPKPPTSSTPATGPPLPPPPPSQYTQNEPSELDGSQGYPYHQQQQQQYYERSGHSRAGSYAQQQEQTKIPPIEPGWLPDCVKDKTTSDLQHLLTNPQLQSAILSNPSTTHPSLTHTSNLLPPLLNTNLHLTTSLSNLESTLAQKRSQTQSRLLSLRALENAHRTKLVETEDALSAFSPMALYQRLNAAVTEQESLVQGLEESWMDEEGVAGEREVEAFVRRVKEGRKLGVLRQERRGRWDEGRVGGWR